MASSSTSSAKPPTMRSLFPPEVILHILTELWEAPQTPQERAALLKNNALVNHIWLALLVRVISRHVHIPNPLSPEAFLRLLPSRDSAPDMDDPFTSEAKEVANEACRSLTFHVDRSVWLDSQPVVGEVPKALGNVLNMASSPTYLPNLQHVSFHYTDWAYDDIFDQLFVEGLPSQVTHLSIKAASEDSAEMDARSVYNRHEAMGVTHPNVQHLSLSGVPTEFVADMLQLCPNVKTLEIADSRSLRALVPLPGTVRTLVLRHPGVVLSKEQILEWSLCWALSDGLFRVNNVDKPRVIVRSGTPDPLTFTELRRACRRFDAEVTYERDESLGE